MKKILILTIWILATNAQADWDLESKKVFKEATKNFYNIQNNKAVLKQDLKQDSFEKYYVKTLKKLSKKKFKHRKTVKEKGYSITLYATDKDGLEVDCSQYERIHNCLYGNYESRIFIVKTKKNNLHSIGHSFVLPFEVKRFGSDGVEQEILIFKGKKKLVAKQANW